MNRYGLLLGGAVLVAAAVGCYSAAGPEPVPSSSAPVQSVDGTEPVSALAADLPCDVASVLSQACASCHGETLANGAPNHLLSYDNLAAPSLLDPAMPEAARCLARMKNAAKPMPPVASEPTVSDAQIAVLEKWIANGLPKATGKLGGCSAASSPIDFTVEETCTSKQHWGTFDDRGSDDMHPGVACNECHAKVNRRDAPVYPAAGTIFPTAHEPNDCYGDNGAKHKVTVVITDSTGAVFTAHVSQAGNFRFSKPIKMPYRAKLVRDGVETPMLSEQTDGDCNVCHTSAGKKDARGRIALPL